jgi:Family of unknown function (DUF6516)
MFNMKATLIARTRIVYSAHSFAELVLWRVPTPVLGSAHDFKYRLAYVVEMKCVVRYDNEVGKGDHRHFGVTAKAYKFSTPERPIVDFRKTLRGKSCCPSPRTWRRRVQPTLYGFWSSRMAVRFVTC